MRKGITALISFALVALVPYKANAAQYPTMFRIDAVTETSLLCVDGVGDAWRYDTPREDWMRNDLVGAIMDDNGTPTKYDDIIVSLRYVGTVEDYVSH